MYVIANPNHWLLQSYKLRVFIWEDGAIFPATTLANLSMQSSDQHPYNYEYVYKNICLYYSLTIKSKLQIVVQSRQCS